MKVAVFGGTGRIGSLVTSALLDAGHEVSVLSRHTHSHAVDGRVEYRVCDITDEDSVRLALADSDVVYDLTDARTAPGHFISGAEVITQVLSQLGAKAKIVSLSIVNCADSSYSYYRAKAEQERIYREYPRANVLRASQFFSFLDMIFDAGKPLGLILSPARTSFQPVSENEVAAELLRAVEEEMPEGWVLVGPSVLRSEKAAVLYKQARQSRRPILRFWMPGALGTFLRAAKNIDTHAPRGIIEYTGIGR